MNPKNRKVLIHGIIALAIYVLFHFIPAISPITPMGVKLIGLMIAYYYSIITIGDMGMCSIIAIILFGFSGYTNLMSSVVGAIGSAPLNIILAIMMFGGVMSLSGLDKGLAELIVSFKLANKSPWMLTLFLMLAAVIPAALLSVSMPVLIILWRILYNIFDVAGFKRGEKWPALMMCAVMFLAQFAAPTMPYSGSLQSNFGIFQGMNPGAPMFRSGGYFLFSLILNIVIVIVFWLILRYGFKPDMSKLQNYKAPAERVKFNLNQKRALWLLILFIVIALVPSVLPAGAVKDWMSNFGVIGAAYVSVAIALIIRNKDGSPYMKFMDVAKTVPWHIILLIGTVMLMCTCFSDESLGIGEGLTLLLTPIASSVGLFGSFVILVLIALIISNVLNNFLAAILIMTIIGPVCTALGVSPSGFAAILERPCEFGILTPSSTPSTAMLYDETSSGWFTKKTIVSFALIAIAAYFVFYVPIGYLTVGWVG